MADSPTMEVRARLTAETAQFTRGIETARQSVETLSNASSRLRGSMVAIGVASGTAAAALITFGTKSFMAAARVDELDVALNAVGKSTGKGYKTLNDAALAIKSMGIEMEVAQKSTLKYAQNNLDLSKASEVARVAQDLAVIGAMNSTDAFDRLTHAIITGRSEILKSVGIQKSAGQAYAEFATSIGKTAKQLSYEEKQAAILNMVLAEGARVAGTYEAAMTTPGKVLRSFARLHNNLQVAVGDVLVKAFGPMIFETYELYKSFIKAVEGGGRFQDILSAVQLVLVKLTTPITNFIKGLKDVVTRFNESKISIKDFASQLELALPVIAAVGSAFAVFAGKHIFALVPILGSVLSKLNPFMIALTVLTTTSTPLRNAMGKLLTALQPLIQPLMQLGKIASSITSYGVLVLAKAINILALVVNKIITFVKNNIAVFKTLGAVVGGVATGFLVYRGIMLLTTAATSIWTAVTRGATIAVSALRSAILLLNITMAFNPFALITAAIVGLIAAFIYLMQTNETFRTVVANVFNFVIKTVIKVFAWFVSAIASVIKGLGFLITTIGYLPKVVVKVFEFIMDAIISWYQLQLKAIKFVIDGFIKLMESHGLLYDIVRTVFNGIIRIITVIIGGALDTFALLITGIIKLVQGFNWLLEAGKDIFFAVLNVIAKVGDGIFGIFRKIAEGLGKFLGSAFDLLTNWVRGLADLLSFIPGIAEGVNHALDKVRAGIVAFPSKIVGFGEGLFDSVINGAKKAINGVVGIGEGVEKGLTTARDFLKNLSTTVKEFGKEDNGAKIIENMINGAKKVSSTLGTMINTLQKVKNFDASGAVDKFINGSVEKLNKASEFLVGLTASMLDFANNTNFAAKAGDAIGNLVDSIKNNLKSSLGFGDILAEEKKKYSDATKDDSGSSAAEKLQTSADQIKRIRDAMRNAIEGMRDVIQDLKDAAKEFADSLKDTIMSFAGLKSIELPDGFIPKAKSLIENMQTRLNKSTQFANQIAQLHSMGLDANSIRALLEEGPIKGAQLAASILSGGAEAIAQINTLQKGIEFTGAALGKYGADVVFNEKIARAEETYAGLTAAEMSIRGANAGSPRVFVEAGAVQIVVDASMTKTAEEMAEVVTSEINRVFGTLAKELSAK